MDTNKMRDISREQFEAWAVVRHKDETWAVHAGLLRRGPDGSYMIEWLEIEWEVWQASREAVVVELPGRDKDPCAYSLGFNACLKKSQEAIKAQGLKVAP